MTATKTPTTDERIATRLAALTKERAERKDLDDLPLAMSRREANAYLAATAELDAKIVTIRNAVATLATLDVEADERWLAFLTSARATCIAELSTLPTPLRAASAQDRAADLSWSIRLIDHGLGIAKLGIVDLGPTRIGALMAAAGFATAGAALREPRGWQGALSEVEARILEQKARCAEAQTALDLALLDDAAVAKQAAEAEAHSAALATMAIRHGADGRLVAYTADDDPLPEAAMSAEQRAAFKRFRRAHETVSV